MNRRIGRVDAITWALVAVLFAASVLDIVNDPGGNGWGGPQWAQLVVAAMTTAPVAAANRFPVSAFLVITAASGGAIAAASPQQAPLEPFLGLMAAVFIVGVRTNRQTATFALGTVLLGGAVVLLTGSNGGVDSTVPAMIWLAAAWTGARLVHARTARAIDAERRVAEQELRQRAVVASERARIAREVHDVVAHNVSIMVVQAQAAQRAGDPALGQQVLRTIETVGRQTVDELRRLLAILRSEDETAPSSVPASLNNLDSLLANARSTGLTVDLDVRGTHDGVPSGVDVAGYRIVQECLTNVITHARASRVLVRVAYGPTCVGITVEDDGAGPATGSFGTDGHGLVGMRERAALYGGFLTADRTAAGGFRVTAELRFGEAPP